jgi:hypothetical protein
LHIVHSKLFIYNRRRLYENRLFTKNEEFTNKINSIQKSWVAGHYDFMNGMKVADLIKMAGGEKSKIAGYSFKHYFRV